MLPFQPFVAEMETKYVEALCDKVGCVKNLSYDVNFTDKTPMRFMTDRMSRVSKRMDVIIDKLLDL